MGIKDAKVSDIHFRRHDNGLYFDKFETKQEAFEYLQNLAERYRATPNWVNNVASLVEEAKQEDGVTLYAKPLSKWFQEAFNLTVKKGRPKGEVQKKMVTVYLEKQLDKRLQSLVRKDDMNLYMRSWFVNLILSLNMGLPQRELVVYFDDEIETDTGVVDKIPVIFYYENEQEIRALNIFSPRKQTQRLIEEWCLVGQEQGMKQIKQRAIRQGLQTLGGNLDE